MQLVINPTSPPLNVTTREILLLPSRRWFVNVETLVDVFLRFKDVRLFFFSTGRWPSANESSGRQASAAITPEAKKEA